MEIEETAPAAPVVVVETAPQYVTTGELAASLELLETQLGARIDAALSAAYTAEDQAAGAVVVAEDAAMTAETAVEVAVDAAVTVEEASETVEVAEETQDGPKEPEKRAERADDPAEDKPKKAGYGNPRWYKD